MIRVFHHEISDEVIKRVWRSVPEWPAVFGPREVQKRLENAGVPATIDISYRAADRLVQRWRKAGWIEPAKPRGWRRIKV
jgi:hypothetical protein